MSFGRIKEFKSSLGILGSQDWPTRAYLFIGVVRQALSIEVIREGLGDTRNSFMSRKI
jgi:hypothetical protein